MKKQKPYLSNSSIKTFLDCNKKYEYQHIDKINISQNKSSKHLSFGKSIHTALAKFNAIKDPSLKTEDKIHDLMRENWIREGYDSVEEEREFGLKGLNMLTNYINNPLDQGKETLFIEESIYLDLGQCFLCGRIDKAYRKDDGSLEILDYKTGNNIYPIDNLQFPIYLILAKHKLGCYPDFVSHYFLAKNKKITREVTQELIDELTVHVYELCYAILQRKTFEHKSTPYCKKNCQFYNLCQILNSKKFNPLKIKM